MRKFDMLNWLITLWTSAFVKVVKINNNSVLVNIDFGSYMMFWSVLLVVIGIALGTFGTMIVLKFLGRTK
ncbi:MAG: hypothetical protein [Arizlama microvirus]|nr:MAG: hypothetical protein [Arizlama microvirus]